MRTIVVFVLLCCATLFQAQEITTMWPYKYPDFREGTVFLKNKQTLLAPLNIHLLKSRLHYLDKEQIKEVTISDIVLVQIDNDKYYVRDNQLMRVIGGDSIGFVAELVLANFNAIKESEGAYGSSSSVQAVRQLSSLEVGGVNITNHMELKSKKDEGSELPVTKKYFIVTIDDIYPASNKGIESKLPDGKRAEFKSFVKKHKIKWKDPVSLITLLEFFKE